MSGKESPHKVARARTSDLEFEAFSGLLPPPALTREYEAILPGTTERLLNIIEVEGNHRRELETRGANHIERMREIDRAERSQGQWIGAALVIFAIVAAVYVASIGQPGPAMVIAGTSIAAILGAYIYRPAPRTETAPERTSN